MTVEITFVRESIQGDEHTTASFRIIPEIMADVSRYDPKELLVILFNHVTNFLVCRKRVAFRLGAESSDKSVPVPTDCWSRSYIETSKFLHCKGVLNIQNLKDDYCFLWCILAHIHRVDKHKFKLYYYKKYINELDIAGLNFPLKFSDTLKFENLNPSICVNVWFFENNEVFTLYASKHRDRKHHVNLLMISKQRRQVSLPSRQGLFRSRRRPRALSTSYISVPVLPLLLLGGAAARSSPAWLFRPSRAESGVHHDPKKNIKKFKAVAKTLHVPFVLYADFEAFLVPAEETKESASNTKVRQLHKPSGFACLRVSQVAQFNREIFKYSGKNSMTVFFEHIKDQDRYVRSILSDVKPMKTLTAQQQLQHAAALPS